MDFMRDADCFFPVEHVRAYYRRYLVTNVVNLPQEVATEIVGYLDYCRVHMHYPQERIDAFYNWGEEWYQARILQVEEDRILIRYDGSSFDDWLDVELDSWRIDQLGKKARQGKPFVDVGRSCAWHFMM
eukprot:TRINITY_DN14603_c0_g2_i1.p1 TRINITY_DN14603_c0_g2~~TRINITY_DN14603_c0_g2_i1.p1  ORF type:complete len:129 (-),score=21.56 TRINITY_DN14603_c0_g2_i1:7-393(-)